MQASRNRLKTASAAYVERVREQRLAALTIEDLPKNDLLNEKVRKALRAAKLVRLEELQQFLEDHGPEELEKIPQQGPSRTPYLVDQLDALLRQTRDKPIPIPALSPDENAEVRDASENLLRAARDLHIDGEHLPPPEQELQTCLDNHQEQHDELKSLSGVWAFALAKLGEILASEPTAGWLLAGAAWVARKLANELADRLIKRAIKYVGNKLKSWRDRRKQALALAPEIERLGQDTDPESARGRFKEQWALAKAKREEHLSLEELHGEYRGDYASYVTTLEGSLVEVAGLEAIAVKNIAGGLPEEIVDRIQGCELELSLLQPDLSLRPYQEFGAKYLITQQRTLLGDEMGLGKTLQSLTLIANLESENRSRKTAGHFLVVAPAGTIDNWLEETKRFTQSIEIYSLMGIEEGRQAYNQWRETGGIAIISYETLRNRVLGSRVQFAFFPLDALVVDEAHWIINPRNETTKAVQAVVNESRFVTFLTGTPMLNEPAEMLNLVRRLQPDLATEIGPIQDNQARSQALAPVYLRREKEMLYELPPLIFKREFVHLDVHDQNRYMDVFREVGHAGALGPLRQAATIGQGDLPSAKLKRLLEILQEDCKERRTLIFSFFVETLLHVAAFLKQEGVHLFGPIYSDVKREQRTPILKEFAKADPPAVLLGQIRAIGQGLNLQAASSVVLLEPQWTPAHEQQAIGRAHRMGQTARNVLVHRMIAIKTVDQYVDQANSRKQKLFDEIAKESSVEQARLDKLKRETNREVRAKLKKQWQELEDQDPKDQDLKK